MKHLLLVRHAKSSWDDFSIKDFDRPLNERGKKDAPMMAKRLLKREIKIDAFIAAPQNGPVKPPRHLQKNIRGIKNSIIFFDELYLAGTFRFCRSDQKHR